jgi:hypothetical protein
MFIAVLQIRQVQGSMFFALGHVFSPSPTRLDLTMQKLLFPTLCDDLRENLGATIPAADVTQYHSQITMGTLPSSSEKLSRFVVLCKIGPFNEIEHDILLHKKISQS